MHVVSIFERLRLQALVGGSGGQWMYFEKGRLH